MNDHYDSVKVKVEKINVRPPSNRVSCEKLSPVSFISLFSVIALF